MKSSFLFLALVLTIVWSEVIDPEFAEFMVRFKKTYSLEDLPQRIAAFKASNERIAKLNEEAEQSKLKTIYALNKFSDLTPEEFKAKFMGYKSISLSVEAPIFKDNGVSIPDSLDWRTKGAVTPVKNQGQCGSCWAFSANEGVESAWILAGKPKIILSPQQIVSCDTEDDGCDGGDLPTAFAYVKQKGQETETKYPYTSGGGDTGSCKFNAQYVVAHISGFQYATKNRNETQMQAAMVTKGPLSVCVDAETWQDYSGGIVKSDCGTDLDHCVQIVGWAKESNTPYWIVRNSWGTDWGLDGYIYIERNKDLCGIALEATYVTI